MHYLFVFTFSNSLSFIHLLPFNLINALITCLAFWTPVHLEYTCGQPNNQTRGGEGVEESGAGNQGTN